MSTDNYRSGSQPNDPVSAPAHYLAHPSGVECITITEHMSFLLGNAMKYIWRSDHKSSSIEDLKKARWYLDREISNREAAAAKQQVVLMKARNVGSALYESDRAANITVAEAFKE